MVTQLTEANFETEALQATEPVLIDFWATWCAPCRMFSPTVDSFAEENPNVKVCKVNVDDEPGLAQKYGVMSIPTVIVLKNGEVKDKAVGVQTKDKLSEMTSL